MTEELYQDQYESLFGPIEYVKGVGPARGLLLRRLGIVRPVDLLFHFPRSYQDLTRLRNVDAFEEGLELTVASTVVSSNLGFSPRRRGLSILKARMSDPAGAFFDVVWFNMPWLYDQLFPGRRCFLFGKPKIEKNGRSWQLSNPKVIWRPMPEEDITGDQSDNQAGNQSGDQPGDKSPTAPGSETEEYPPYLPNYPLTEGLKSFHLQRIIRPLLDRLPQLLTDIFPDAFRQEHQLVSLAEAIRSIHFPESIDALHRARRRFIYQEFFLFQLALGLRRRQHIAWLKSESFPGSPRLLTRIYSRFPYEMTDAQKRVIGEISDDLGRSTPMNRLLQGDVGSGKTLVAAAAILQVIAHRHQAVLMAPTEILARQHLQTFTRLLEDSQVKIVGLFGGQKNAERAAILEKIASGEADLIIGTQAIIAGNITFARLGLVVIDEQHKFGVLQRARLKSGTGFDPHYLVMTATPIPRSVTMTLFGDLDVSLLDAVPPGRKPVKTYIVAPKDQPGWWAFFREKIERGRQGYVVVPRVGEKSDDHPIEPILWEEEALADIPVPTPIRQKSSVTENEELGEELGEESASTLKSVDSIFRELAEGPLKGLRLGILHGRMSTEEKQRVMLDFRSREIEVLVTTTVIEVGVDVPNASLMAIENADRFGLAQLHQLRGRVGRGRHPGFCAVFRTEDSTKQNQTEAETAAEQGGQGSSNGSSEKKKSGRGTKQKKEKNETTGNLLDRETPLDVFASSTDGFYLAERDLQFRGPGDLFGTRQHGLCSFRVADIARDQEILLETRRDAGALLDEDPGLCGEEHRALRSQVLKKYGTALNLGDVG